jgi:CYTH domain-containing protein
LVFNDRQYNANGNRNNKTQRENESQRHAKRAGNNRGGQQKREADESGQSSKLRRHVHSSSIIRSENVCSNNRVFCENAPMPPEHKYAKIERERRFLLSQFPGNADIVRTRRIIDRYIDGTTLRFRKLIDADGLSAFKLTQKIPARDVGGQQGLIVTMYLTEAEFGVFEQLPAHTLAKTRHSVPPFGIDVFDGQLEGLILAEAEFDSAAAADALTIPSYISREVSHDDRFTGGQLVRTSRQDLRTCLLEFGINIASP